ncbi:acetyl-CoA carboxylase biotin carboxyl carrier protein [Paenirhodobacter populi]|uniref:Biotin carboxyl carrier protein of acetyl-CoA carboxylase n=1 Tax=Paenirhodobacter populi TaxID=2306993 RepID=A0A443IVG0_9RHOB|nr:biotin/lipoyl-containing protein [Sinirhodobacter populi]RWR12109.1 acetyl-CoA carboxylase biotin carboxyl carrier protein subunit [Sinirhodobacter populi]
MDISKIRSLIEIFGQSRLAELVVSEEGTTVRILRGEAAPEAPATVAPPPPKEAPHSIRAPMFGIVHATPNPGAAPFVSPGDKVEPGQPLCVIEAMKVFSVIAADRAGTIARILFEDGAEVDVDQPLVEYA